MHGIQRDREVLALREIRRVVSIKAARDFVRALVIVLVVSTVAELVPLVPVHGELARLKAEAIHDLQHTGKQHVGVAARQVEDVVLLPVRIDPGRRLAEPLGRLAGSGERSLLRPTGLGQDPSAVQLGAIIPVAARGSKHDGVVDRELAPAADRTERHPSVRWDRVDRQAKVVVIVERVAEMLAFGEWVVRGKVDARRGARGHGAEELVGRLGVRRVIARPNGVQTAHKHTETSVAQHRVRVIHRNTTHRYRPRP
mmetsp:Transcript_72584/g.206703  ORF Transcript_72584/g.206703 Transcript_72584/m.206703 type:complete len:255 (+) Transcript_72584:1770-2534(+)